MANEKEEEKGVPKSAKGWLVFFFPYAIALISAIFGGWITWKIEKSKEEHEKDMYNMQNDYDQRFYSSTCTIEKFGIEYVQYEFTSKPAVAGYHVIVYPYVVYEKEGRKFYIPFIGQFTQNEYMADENGYCQLFKENTNDDFKKMVVSKTNLWVEIKCLAAIQYVEDGETKREVYDVRDGQLVISEQEVVIEVLTAYEDENHVKIDMLSWPYFDYQALEEIFK